MGCIGLAKSPFFIRGLDLKSWTILFFSFSFKNYQHGFFDWMNCDTCKYANNDSTLSNPRTAWIMNQFWFMPTTSYDFLRLLNQFWSSLKMGECFFVRYLLSSTAEDCFNAFFFYFYYILSAMYTCMWEKTLDMTY
jgi:hypothetical protein